MPVVSLFYHSALLPWTYFPGALQGATNAVVDHQYVITKVYFSRLVPPLSAVLSGLVDFAISFVMFLGILLFYGIPPTAAALLLPGFLLLAMLTALGVGLWLSTLHAIYRDVRYVVPFLVQFWVVGVIEGFRWALTGHGQPPNLLLAASACAVLLVVGGGLVYFQKMEATIADVV